MPFLERWAFLMSFSHYLSFPPLVFPLPSVPIDVKLGVEAVGLKNFCRYFELIKRLQSWRLEKKAWFVFATEFYFLH